MRRWPRNTPDERPPLAHRRPRQLADTAGVFVLSLLGMSCLLGRVFANTLPNLLAGTLAWCIPILLATLHHRMANRSTGWPLPAANRCANCGYDLRATPERCPECGRLTATPDLRDTVGPDD